MPKNRFRYHKSNIIKSTNLTIEKRSHLIGVFSWLKLNVLLIIIITITIVTLIIYSPIFFINHDKITYLTQTDFNTDNINQVIDEHLNSYYLYIFPRKNIWFFDDIQIENAFADHPYINNLDIKKKILHNLEINYKVREPKFVITNNTDYFLVDIDGFVLGKLDIIDNHNTLPKIIDPIASYNVGDKIYYQNFLTTIQTIWDTFNNKSTDFYITNISLSASGSELNVYTNENWYVLFNLEDDINHQLRVLEKVLQNNITDRAQLHYIDLRVNDWVYYQ